MSSGNSEISENNQENNDNMAPRNNDLTTKPQSSLTTPEEEIIEDLNGLFFFLNRFQLDNIFIMFISEIETVSNNLDSLNSALDLIEQRNDNIHAQLLALLKSSRQIREAMREENNKQNQPSNEGQSDEDNKMQ